MDTTITLEFFSETKEHLKTLEQQLKQEHDVDVDLLEPKEATAPVLVAIGIKNHGERAERHHPELCVEAKDKQANKDARQKYPANMI